tara:strand:+ start:12865 stop:14202 length:1338 start_codon:yes stop_codon:yes gene_type:complete
MNETMKRIHVIAIGGAIMHNLAIALSNRKYSVTGSDDAIYDPAKANLEKAGLYPQTIGWDADSITADIDFIILGMHARANNPELIKAQELGLSILSFPEFIALEAKEKKRIVVAGSHGKTTTTAMIMHVLSKLNRDFDYVVGSSIEGFDLSVKLSDAPLIIIEGDEYLTSPLDLRSKFLWYQPHVSIITGIAYDHINVFPTWELYVDTFKAFIETHTDDTKYFWYAGDETLAELSKNTEVANEQYDTPTYFSDKSGTRLTLEGAQYTLSIVGKHNLENLRAAELVCSEIGISHDEFYTAAADFSGAGRRMEKIAENSKQVVYRDFAHSPSKLKATTAAIKETYEGDLLAVFELHTFSSLTKDFLPLYKDSMNPADKAIVFFSEGVFEHKKMPVLSAEYVAECFGNVDVITDKNLLEKVVRKKYVAGANVLLMSSGTFSGATLTWD